MVVKNTVTLLVVVGLLRQEVARENALTRFFVNFALKSNGRSSLEA